MSTAAELLAAYDAQLRGEPEVRGGVRREQVGPVWISYFLGGRAFITCRDFTGLDVGTLVAEAVARATADPEVVEAEWKTRAHDDAPGLHEALVERGFLPQEPESIMIGAAELLALDLPVPDGVRIRSVTDVEDVRRGAALADEVFGESGARAAEAHVTELLGRIERGAELWIAEADGAVVCSGRMEPVAGTGFAGIWGGATRPEWRRRGIYRALTAERAKSAVRQGIAYVNSDSTEHSRPILERSGFVKVSTTTPYEWHR